MGVYVHDRKPSCHQDTLDSSTVIIQLIRAKNNSKHIYFLKGDESYADKIIAVQQDVFRALTHEEFINYENTKYYHKFLILAQRIQILKYALHEQHTALRYLQEYYRARKLDHGNRSKKEIKAMKEFVYIGRLMYDICKKIEKDIERADRRFRKVEREVISQNDFTLEEIRTIITNNLLMVTDQRWILPDSCEFLSLSGSSQVESEKP